MKKGDLRRMAEAAKRFYEQKTNSCLPWNLAGWGPTINMETGAEASEEQIAEVKHFCRFLRCLATSSRCGELRNWLGHQLDATGCNSPKSRPYLWSVVKVFKRPEDAAAVFSSTRKRADEILNSYGLRTANSALADLLEGRSQWIETAPKSLGQYVAQLTLKEIFKRKLGLGAGSLIPCELDIFKACEGVKAVFNRFDENEAIDRDIRCWIAECVIAGRFANIAEAVAHKTESPALAAPFRLWKEQLVSVLNGTRNERKVISYHQTLESAKVAYDAEVDATAGLYSGHWRPGYNIEKIEQQKGGGELC